jgi:hypothetical protein
MAELSESARGHIHDIASLIIKGTVEPLLKE